MTWGFAGPGEILFGEGAARDLGKRAAALGSRAFVVTGRDPGRARAELDALLAAGLSVSAFPASGEPTFDVLRAALAEARRFSGATGSGPEPGPPAGLVVIGIGGGSALDLAKGVAVLLGNPGDPLEYAEVVGAGKLLARPAAPVIAVPTTAGTGSEATRNAVFAEPSRGVKVSLRSPTMLPRVALVDPELCLQLPPDPTAYTGMDALVQTLEPYVSSRANPMTDALCESALAEAPDALLRAFRNGSDLTARSVLSRVSLFGGLALGNAGLGAVHGLAAPLGGSFQAPHGAVCAVLLAPVVRANLRALRERDPGGPALARYARAAGLVTGRQGAAADDLADYLDVLAGELGIPRLAAWGVREADLTSLAETSLSSSSMKANPVVLTAVEIAALLREAL